MSNHDMDRISDEEFISLLAEIQKQAQEAQIPFAEPLFENEDMENAVIDFKGLSNEMLGVFENALTSIIAASDYGEYVQSGRSVILQHLTQNGIPKEEAAKVLEKIGQRESAAAGIYIECLEAFEVEPIFDLWSQQPDSFNTAMQRVMDAIDLVLENAEMIQY